ncbi:MAG TPA: hypothetical protein VHE83_10635 [Mycobacteriales bacterium]|nr:hypothetical protein [Mycobacteriales bacterium]
MGLGGDYVHEYGALDYEWIDLQADEPALTFSDAEVWAEQWLADHAMWQPGPAERLLLVDLDNLRAEPARLRDRLALVRVVARTADRAFFAGETATVARCRAALDDGIGTILTVGSGPDAADLALLEAARRRRGSGQSRRAVQFVVVSNDHIFARVARHGTLTLLSPDLAAASRQLRAASTRAHDVKTYERPLTAALLRSA